MCDLCNCKLSNANWFQANAGLLFIRSQAGYTHADTQRAKTGCACMQSSEIKYLQTACMYVYMHECMCIHVCIYVAYLTFHNVNHKCIESNSKHNDILLFY